MKHTRKFLSLLLSSAMLLSLGVIPVSGAPAAVAVPRTDDMERYGVHTTFRSNQSTQHNYGEFGGEAAGVATVSNKVAHSGEKSLCMSGVYGIGSTLKVNNLFTTLPKPSDLSRTYRISFFIYPDKEAGVYKASGTSSPSQATPFTAEELSQSIGTEFAVTMAGPDGQHYKYRTGDQNILGSTPTFFARWNEWTEISFYYTLKSGFLDNGKTSGSRVNTLVNSFRLGQKTIDYTVNQGLANTFYIDDLRVEEVGVALETSYIGEEVGIRTTHVGKETPKKMDLYLLEYDSEGRLIHSEKADISAGKQEIGYNPKNPGARVDALVLDTSDAKSPKTVSRLCITPTPEEYGYVTLARAFQQAERVLTASTAVYADAGDYQDRMNKENIYFFAEGDTVVYRAADRLSTVSGTQTTLPVTPASEACLNFDLSPLKEEAAKSVSYAYLRLYPQKVDKAGEFSVALMETAGWDETTLKGSNCPAFGTAIDTVNVEYAEVVCYFDVTDAVNAALQSGLSDIAFAIKGSGSASATFISMESTTQSFKPCLLLEGLGMAAGEKALSTFDTDTFETVMKRKHTPEDNMVPTPTRTLETLDDFTVSEEAPRVNQYGGWLDGGKYEATGFFRTELIDGRWWIIDPEGYKTIHMAAAKVTSGSTSSPVQTAALKEVYGSTENWVNQIPDEMREYGFNGAGPWSDYQSMLDMADKDTTPLVQAAFSGGASFAGKYWYDAEESFFHVFDPEFEAYAYSLAKTYVAPYADSPYILGWITDNEPPASDDMLMKCLRADPTDSSKAYSYAAAWAWLRARHGEDVKTSQVTAQDKVDFVTFVYDRYMQVCTAAIRTYDKNHMILGPKLDKPNQGSFRGCAPYCDIILYDYYGNAWDADLAQVDEWYRWAGKPMINAEWYVKGMDACTPESDLTNEAGVGFSVETQAERGDYFQSFTLSMLESKVFVGWQWFKYMDNDPKDPTQDVSNINANKGIFTREFEPQKEILSAMKEIHYSVYDLIDYFDN